MSNVRVAINWRLQLLRFAAFTVYLAVAARSLCCVSPWALINTYTYLQLEVSVSNRVHSTCNYKFDTITVRYILYREIV